MKTFVENLLKENNQDENASIGTDLFVFRHFNNSSSDWYFFFLPLSLFLLGHYLIPSLYLSLYNVSIRHSSLIICPLTRLPISVHHYLYSYLYLLSYCFFLYLPEDAVISYYNFFVKCEQLINKLDCIAPTHSQKAITNDKSHLAWTIPTATQKYNWKRK